ncbi:MAG: ribulokinase [Bacteroidales bacterium 36-12]|nr:MAG: ribulokinase [Bacteroidales bacterium 36-12]
MGQHTSLVIGIDYGSDSVRSLLVDAITGEELAVSVFEYPRWKKKMYCDESKNQFRQHPLDYIEGLEYTVKDILSQQAIIAQNVKAITFDTTGSTPAPVNEKCVPLALLPEFADNPDAMFVLWKDHTAIQEAEDINTLSRTWGGVDFTKYSGGIYSSEWFWAKALHITRKNESVSNSAYSWIEHTDWMTALLTGQDNPAKIKRNRCAAGHKAMWHTEWGGFPSADFLGRLNSNLAKVRLTLNDETLTCDTSQGVINKEWAQRLGLPETTLIGTSALDAHMGAIGGEIKPYHLSKVVGTSTCDMLTVPSEEMQGVFVKGISGQVDGSITPGMEGLEAGQSAFGDIYAWFKDILMWPIDNVLDNFKDIDDKQKAALVKKMSSSIIVKLTEEAEKIPVGVSGVIALDWMNGRRTPDANQNLKGAIAGLTIGTKAPQIFRALVEATAYGSRAIMERFLSEGIRVDEVVALGGVAKKSPFVMQTLADVLNRPIKVAASEQTCALGAAMCAAVVADIYDNIEVAQDVIGKGFDKEYFPNEANSKLYNELYEQYLTFGEFVEEY